MYNANPRRKNLTGGGAGAEEVHGRAYIACQLLPSAGTGTCIDLSNPGKMYKGCFASFQRYYSLQEKLENHAVVLARIQPALASKRQMEPAPSSSAPKRQSVPPRPLALA